ncbi:hypothetical protein SALBM311S_02781 [Streptomyces alboniger]
MVVAGDEEALPYADLDGPLTDEPAACLVTAARHRARLVMDCSASCMARTSAPRSRPSPKEPRDEVPSDTSDARVDCAANTAKSSTSCSRFADFVQLAPGGLW